MDDSFSLRVRLLIDLLIASGFFLAALLVRLYDSPVAASILIGLLGLLVVVFAAGDQLRRRRTLATVRGTARAGSAATQDRNRD